MFLKDKADLAYSKLADIPSLKCYLKPEACTFLWTQLEMSSFLNIKDDEDFCEKLATEENLVLLPGITQYHMHHLCIDQRSAQQY
ncbi:hypothetical protein F2Q70_00032972 [Brassica cretica]|uniref:Uncharacterized protein n=2 Tax=Brassica cretica TaxID=69181 RepID=A0A8S9FEY1_BRACR|nr:hypothetical protein F2Q70_00032972 [Brassica cretica]KAF2552312.1 hypothetical protein F2Q68_00037329 [Brassica cretica]KAF3595862.1 hypothetical protein DY000_02027171 [Brassica cretica]